MFNHFHLFIHLYKHIKYSLGYKLHLQTIIINPILPTAPATSAPKFAGEVEEWRGPDANEAAAVVVKAGLRTTPPLNDEEG